MADILGYVRVLKTEQDLDGQRHRFRDARAMRNFDDAISGRTFKRPGLTTLLDYARPGHVLCIVRLDRLGRSLRDLLETVAMLLQRSIALMSREEYIETTSAAGELVFHVYGAITHTERRLIADRTSDGLQATAAKGRLPDRLQLEKERIESALVFIEAGLPPASAAGPLGIGRSTLHRVVAERKAV